MKNQNVISDENVLRMYKNILRKGNVSEETKSQIVDGLNQLIDVKLNTPSKVRVHAEYLLDAVINGHIITPNGNIIDKSFYQNNLEISK
jgi:hypothetical protein